MPRILMILTILLGAFTGHAKEAIFRCAGSTILVIDSARAAGINSHEDAYTHEHTPFDLAIRFNHEGAKEEEYLKSTAINARNWTESEVDQLKEAYTAIDAFAKASTLNLHMPDTVLMIRTNGNEEFGAEGWTRENRIMLNTGAQPISTHLVAHELWHVISRRNEQLRNSAYAVFHFKPCNNIIYKPALHNKVITNPDCPFITHYITLDAGGKPQDAALILYSKEDFHTGYGMDKYANIGLLALTGDDQHKQPLMMNGEPVILELTDAPDLFKQIGTNTQYLLHIEEITAEHFAAAVTGAKFPQMEYVEGVKKALMN